MYIIDVFLDQCDIFNKYNVTQYCNTLTSLFVYL